MISSGETFNMSTVFESAIDSFLEKNGVGTGAGTASAREIMPLGLNAEKVVSRRYSLRDENGEPVETWADIVRRVVGHVSRAETDPIKQKLFYNVISPRGRRENFDHQIGCSMPPVIFT